METFDLCILGAGPGGYAAAMRAHDLGKRVALVERGRVGGAGIHSGALSSKTMWHLSNDVFRALRTEKIVMFVILFIHVGVAVAFGYWWIW